MQCVFGCSGSEEEGCTFPIFTMRIETMQKVPKRLPDREIGIDTILRIWIGSSRKHYSYTFRVIVSNGFDEVMIQFFLMDSANSQHSGYPYKEQQSQEGEEESATFPHG